MRPSKVKPGQRYTHREIAGLEIEVQTHWGAPRGEKWQCIYRRHIDPSKIGCVLIKGADSIRSYWRQVEEPVQTDLELVLEIAQAWAGEYGFSVPATARRVLEAVQRLREEREREPRAGDVYRQTFGNVVSTYVLLRHCPLPGQAGTFDAVYTRDGDGVSFHAQERVIPAQLGHGWERLT